MYRVRVMVLYATFNNISVISVAVRFIGEETGGFPFNTIDIQAVVVVITW
jgi:hypothetical protein